MCRICGRTIKCIFDSMPSRTLIQHIPSRRAFTTARAQPTRPPLASSRPQNSPSSALTASFSTLRLSPRTPKPTPTTLSHTGTLTTRALLPLASASASPSQTLTQLPTRRSFSTTPTLLGHRRRMDTFSPSRRVQKRRHGYLSRVRTKNGQKTLKNRRLRGRKDLSW